MMHKEIHFTVRWILIVEELVTRVIARAGMNVWLNKGLMIQLKGDYPDWKPWKLESDQNRSLELRYPGPW